MSQDIDDSFKKLSPRGDLRVKIQLGCLSLMRKQYDGTWSVLTVLDVGETAVLRDLLNASDIRFKPAKEVT